MGKHYVSQKYLNGFCDTSSPGHLWLFDKNNMEFSPKPIPTKVLAQSPGFYSDNVEQILTHSVEVPANTVLDKLRNGTFDITLNEKALLSIYIATQMKRVSNSRDRSMALIPRVTEEVRTEFRETISQLKASGDISETKRRELLSNVDKYGESYAQAPTSLFKLIADDPLPSEKHVRSIYDMTWHFVVSRGSERYITGDNPAFFFQQPSTYSQSACYLKISITYARKTCELHTGHSGFPYQ